MSEDRSHYRLVVVRRAPLPAPEDLAPTLDWLVETLQAAEPETFTLSGLSPAMRTFLVREGDESRVPAFLACSEIAWSFGREDADPTHEVAFFNPHRNGRQAFLRVSFVAGDAVSTGPGLVVDLRLGRDAAGPADEHRGAHLEKLFSYLVSAIHPDFGHVELPGHPDPIDRPDHHQVGWLTYFARTEATVPPVPEPAVAIEDEAGTKILATPHLALETHADLAAAIAALDEALHAADAVEPEAPEAQPAAPPVQQATFMAPPQPAFASFDSERTQIGPAPAWPAAALPFQAPEPGAPPPAVSPFQPPAPATPPAAVSPPATPPRFEPEVTLPPVQLPVSPMTTLPLQPIPRRAGPPADAPPLRARPAATPFEVPSSDPERTLPPAAVPPAATGTPAADMLRTMTPRMSPFAAAAAPGSDPMRTLPLDPLPRRSRPMPAPPEPTPEALEARRRLAGLPFSPGAGQGEDPQSGQGG